MKLRFSNKIKKVLKYVDFNEVSFDNFLVTHTQYFSAYLVHLQIRPKAILATIVNL